MDKIINGKVFVFGDNIDTDQIYPGRFVQYTEKSDIVKYAMFGVDESFPQKVEKGDIVIAGKNFGCGSSREHAAITLKESGVGLILATSFARIFYRNAINLGLPAVVCKDIASLVKNGETLTVNLESGKVLRSETEIATTEPISDYLLNILNHGGIKGLIKAQLESRS